MQTVEFDTLIDEMRRAFDGDPWHGPSVMAALDGVDARAAGVRVAPEVHTIHELVLHLAAWAGEVAQRLRGREAREPEEGDWPPTPTSTDEAAWKAALTTLRSAHAEALAAVEALGADRLHEVVDDRRNAALGTGGSFAFTAHGLAQHYAYHGGQISVLKKMTQREPLNP